MYDAGFLINAPMLKYIQKNGFYTCSLFSINAPKLETLYSSSFCNSNLKSAVFPSLKSVEKSGIATRSPFYGCSIKVLDMPKLENCAANTLLYNCNQIQYINLPSFNGNLSSSSTYEFLQYYNISKETAELSGLDYYNVDALGGSIRVTDAGMRFGFSFDEGQTDKVEEYGFVYAASGVSPNALRMENADGKNIFKLVANNRITHENNVTTFNLVLTDVPKSAYDFEISARAYVKIDGIYYYSDMLTRSFIQIAQAVLADEAIDDVTKEKIKAMRNA